MNADSFFVADEAAWKDAWAWLSPKLNGRNTIALVGNLGAGKTTFVKTIVAELGLDAHVTSPTFSIVQEYSSSEGPIFHFDLYRLNHLEEVLELDFEGYLDAGRLCIVEWPEIAEPLLRPEETCWVTIQLAAEGGRVIRIKEC